MENKKLRLPLASLSIIWCVVLWIFRANWEYVLKENPLAILSVIILPLVIAILLFMKKRGLILGSAVLVCSIFDALFYIFTYIQFGINWLFALIFPLLMAIFTFFLFFLKGEKIKLWVRKLWWIPGVIHILYYLSYFHFYLNPERLICAILSIVTTFSFCRWMANPYEKEKISNGEVDCSIEDKLMYCGLFKQIVLIFFFGMIYISIWVYRMTRYLNLVSNRSYRSPGVSLMFFWLVPFYSLFWWYETSKRVEERGAQLGREYHVAGLYTLLSVFFSFIPAILLQNKVNEFSIVAQAEVRPVGSTSASGQESVGRAKIQAEELKMFKDLLDEGAITPEEYEKKKKEILG